jgi:hypothetical protein
MMGLIGVPAVQGMYWMVFRRRQALDDVAQ